MENEVFTTADVMKILKVNRHTLSKWVRAGKISAVRVGRKWLFSKEEIERVLREGVQV